MTLSVVCCFLLSCWEDAKRGWTGCCFFFLLLLCVPLCCGPHGAGDVRMCPRWDLLLEGYSSSSVYGFINHILYTVNGV